MFTPKLTLALGLSSLFLSSAFAAVEVKEAAGKVAVTIDGQPFTEYCYTGAPHVYFYPVYGPGGAKMTRDWPMKDVANEDHDHPHHRSLWFAHGAVNGVDFWSEPESWGNKPPKTPLGQILHEKFLELKGGEAEGVIKSVNQWKAADGSIPITSTQTFRVYERPANERLFDFEVELKAGDQEVVMGDTKEGSMAMRIAESMKIGTAKKPGQGHMVNSEGVKDVDCWGKRANWVDYVGPVDGKTLGIAIFDHPKNPRHPTRWHARDYGLFAANPFCEHDMDKTQPEGAGDMKIAPGQSVTFRYRFYLHEGDTEQAKVADHYAEYTQSVP